MAIVRAVEREQRRRLRSRLDGLPGPAPGNLARAVPPPGRPLRVTRPLFGTSPLGSSPGRGMSDVLVMATAVSIGPWPAGEVAPLGHAARGSRPGPVPRAALRPRAGASAAGACGGRDAWTARARLPCPDLPSGVGYEPHSCTSRSPSAGIVLAKRGYRVAVGRAGRDRRPRVRRSARRTSRSRWAVVGLPTVGAPPGRARLAGPRIGPSSLCLCGRRSRSLASPRRLCRGRPSATRSSRCWRWGLSVAIVLRTTLIVNNTKPSPVVVASACAFALLAGTLGRRGRGRRLLVALGVGGTLGGLFWVLLPQPSGQAMSSSVAVAGRSARWRTAIPARRVRARRIVVGPARGRHASAAAAARSGSSSRSTR